MKRRTRVRAPEHGTLDVAWTSQPFPVREPHEWLGLRNAPAASVVVRLLAPHAEKPAAVQASVAATSKIRRQDTSDNHRLCQPRG